MSPPIQRLMKTGPVRSLALAVGRLASWLTVCRDLYEENKIRAKSELHPSVRIGRGTAFPGSGTVVMGEGSYVGKNAFLDAHPRGVTIVIGKGCSISHNVQMRTAGYGPWDGQGRDLKVYGDIRIGDGVWVGANAFIRGGVTVGEGAVIGANSVVLKDVPPNSIAVGAPAKILSLDRGRSS